jgi:cytochrome c oxidase assembly protein subunit 15
MVAYLLFAVAALHVLTAWGSGVPGRRALAVFAMVTVQATLGILTLVNVVPVPLALSHQFGAIVVVALATVDVEAVTGFRRPATVSQVAPV